MYLMEGGVTLQITSVNIRRIEKENSRMKGIASVLIDDCFAVHDIRIIQGDNGLFIAMPSRLQNGEYRDIAHPINQETRKLFEDAIFEAYNNAEVKVAFEKVVEEPVSEVTEEPAEELTEESTE